jgi:hypothetical protein
LVLPGTLSTVCTTDFVYGWCDDGNNTPGGGGFTYGYYGSPVVTANGSSDLSASTKGGVSSSTGSVPNPIVVVEEDTYWPGSDLGYPKNWWLDENFQIDPYDQFKKLTQAEKDLVKQFPQEALKIKKNRDVATQKTISQFNENGHNNKSDAFRHAYFQGLNTYSVGAQLTKLFADAHESETPISLNLEKQMDLHNNEKGIDYGSNCPCDIELLEYYVLEGLVKGELKYLSPLDPSNLIIPGVTQLIPTNQ